VPGPHGSFALPQSVSELKRILRSNFGRWQCAAPEQGAKKPAVDILLSGLEILLDLCFAVLHAQAVVKEAGLDHLRVNLGKVDGRSRRGRELAQIL
jgi:hypothetical protein